MKGNPIVKRFFDVAKNKIKPLKTINPLSSSKNFSTLLIPYILVAGILIVLPLIIMVFYSLIVRDDSSLAFRLSFANWIILFENHAYLAVFGYSILMASLTVIISIIVALPICYILKFVVKKRTKMYLLLFTLPIWLNMLLRTLGLKALINWIDPNMLGSLGVMVLGMVLLYLPFMILSIINSMDKIDKWIIAASGDLGANRWTTFWKIIFPLSIPGIINGIILVFLPALTTLIIPEMLGGGKSINIGKIIENYFLSGGNIIQATGIGSMVATMSLFFVLILRFVERKTTFNNDKKKKMEGGE
ncbi:MAG: ABC transporter permease [Mycoplasma sp.]